LYLFRHGAVEYIRPDGNWVEDPDAVDLTDRGRQQAEAMAALFEGVAVDKAICSGLPRTRQTGEIILANRGLQIGTVPGLEEIRPIKGEASGGYDIYSDVAFSHWRAVDEGAQFLGGERYADFYARICVAMHELIADPDWSNMAAFAHGGTNAAVLGWVTGLGLSAFGLLDQATCCLNIIDFDVDQEGQVIRKALRAMNVTAYDPVMRDRHSGDMETLARMILKGVANN
jgi:probable phosphoglycerate mutase